MRLHALIAGLAIALIPSIAAADPKAEAKAHMASAAEAHKAGRFADARTALDAAYALDPQPQLLYALGQVHVKLGQCAEAIVFYEQFLESKPAAAPSAAATQAIETCKVTVAQEAAKAPPPPPPPEPPLEDLDRAEAPPDLAPAPAPSPSASRHVDGPTPFYKDPIGLALVGGGVASLVVGVVYYASARSTLDDAEDAEAAPTYAQSQALVDDASSKRTISVACTIAGVALAGGGIFYYLRKPRHTEPHGVTMVPAQGGGVVSWSGRF